jgi:DNA-binding NarL/FixJ family response regulator
MKTVLLVDDLPEALAMLESAVLDAFPMASCIRAAGVTEARRALTATGFDLALVDLGLTDGDGLEVITCLSERQPQCAIVVATIYDDDEHLFKALQAGAQGYLLKDHPPDWLARQLRGINDGQPALSPAIARKLLRYFQRPPEASQIAVAELSGREREVLGLMAQGIRITDIAVELTISRHTVGDHVKNIYRKLNISSRAEAALHARSLGLI